ncbi:MAG: cell envelope integrity protein CreD [Salaquimonas sp.]|nr:cell envelope integrity protein CreD [Salaquimonas sp.]
MSTSDTVAAPVPSRRSGLAHLGIRSPMGKLVIAGVISFLLMVPAMIVLGFVNERAHRAETVAKEIAAGWGGEQTLNGPYLVLPYRKSEWSSPLYAVFSAEQLKMDLNVGVEERKRSIYRTPLFQSRTHISGRFAPLPATIEEKLGVVDYDSAFMAMSVSDISGFRSEARIDIDGRGKGVFQPGLSGLADRKHRGFSYALPEGLARSGFSFNVDLTLNGARQLTILPSARATEIEMNSDWPHPGFAGRMLPDSRAVTGQGFSASWTIPSLAQGTSMMNLATSLPESAAEISVGFVEPLQFYQVIARTLKYSTAFFALTFLAVFILEVKGNRSIHWMQYALVGLALVIFFLLLLALAEHIGFGPAYAIAATATTMLISWYVGDALRRLRSGVIMAGVLGVIYVVIYLVMSEEDYALLAGSIVAFLTITATMFATRRLEWDGGESSSASPLPEAPPRTA